LQRKNQELSIEECKSILKDTKRGVLSVIGDEGYPYGMPLNHYYVEEEGIIYFPGGKRGHKMDALKENPKVSFCVYDEGRKEEDEWFLRFKSVIVFGKMEILEEEEKIKDIARRLSYKFTSDETYIEEEIRKDTFRTALLALHIEHMCGKEVKEC
ncbi:MAG: pyridoxamine 5'-phosphate oxidase family protein, partial [Solobacterium sp.]|nr:pyridoxamine 5'-phosphate oxidase family protein [Solobacterium sp.]